MNNILNVQTLQYSTDTMSVRTRHEDPIKVLWDECTIHLRCSKGKCSLHAEAFLPAVLQLVLELQHVERGGRLPSLWLKAPGPFPPSLHRVILMNTWWSRWSTSAYLPPRKPPEPNPAWSPAAPSTARSSSTSTLLLPSAAPQTGSRL